MLRSPIALALLALIATATARAQQRVYEYDNGRWFNGRGFDRRTMYVVDDTFSLRRPTHVDSIIDLHNAYVVPPYGEAHNHNVEFYGATRARAIVDKYIAAGVFYVQNPLTIPRARDAMRTLVNTPSSIDATFAVGGITATGGHPTGLFLRNERAGVFTPADSDGGLLWVIDSLPDLNRKWPAILANHPDFIKVFLLYSEEYERRRADSAFFNWRGVDPRLVPEIVRRAHAAGLRVMAHIETAADFHNALVAGVDQVIHMPGFRGDEHLRLPDPTKYMIPDSDAARAERQNTVVVTTLQGGGAAYAANGPDSLLRRQFDSLNARNLRTLERHHVRLAVGSDNYRETSLPEAMYLHALGVFSNLRMLTMWAVTTPKAIFPHRRIAELRPGYEATFLALDGDPLVDFAATERISLRVKQGHVLGMQSQRRN